MMIRIAAVAALMVAAVAPSRAADIEPLLSLVPYSANAVTVVRVGEISPQQRSELFGPGVVPPWVDVVVRAARVNPMARDSEWSVALVPVPEALPFDAVAQRDHAVVQDLAGHKAFRSSRGYVVQLKPGILGIMRTGSRQDAAFWAVQSARGATPGASSYLLDAARAPAQLVLAFDTTNMIDPTGIRMQLSQSAVLNGETAAQNALAALLPTMNGMRAELKFGPTIEAVVRLDFGASVGDSAPAVKALFNEFLSDHGAALPELGEASVSAEGNAVVLRTTLSDDSLRKIATLVAAPTPAAQSMAETMPPTVSPPSTTPPTTPPTSASVDPALAPSQAYYREVSRLIRDLKGLLRNAKDYEKTAMWHDNYARRIDELPIADVDPVVLQFGADTSKNFRALAASLRAIPVKIAELNASITSEIHVNTWTYTGYKYGAFGYVPGPGELQTNVQQVRAAEAQAVAQGADQRSQVWLAIDDEQNRVRIAMQQKFGVDFDMASK